MKHKTLKNRLEKNGLIVSQKGNFFYAVKNERMVEWTLQDDEVICVHVQRTTDQSDPMTDYFPGYFVTTIKAVLEYLNR